MERILDLRCNSWHNKVMFRQKTIQRRVRVEGVGLHTGKHASLTFCPAPPNTGVLFIRADLPDRPTLSTHARFVQATSNATTLGGEHFSVSTVEHCLSAMAALRIDNLYIELDGPEIPIVDGSAKPYLDALLQAGLTEQDLARKYLYITEPVYLGNDTKYVFAVPYSGLRVTATIDFAHPGIGRQHLDLDINEHTFTQQIAQARTFGFVKDVAYLHSKGLALGASLDNAIGLDDSGILNAGGLRFPDEFVRHKVLDALGDLVTLGYPLMGHITLFKAGHDMMNRFVKKVLQSSNCYRLVELGTDPSEMGHSESNGAQGSGPTRGPHSAVITQLN
jgi:UDP-3-O-[3-hydroxymyristoyl] N-acetylglucosamine deacetylase